MSTLPTFDDDGVDDEDLITSWGLVHEAVGATNRLVLPEAQAAGGAVPSGPWFEVLVRLLRTPGHRLPMSHLAREVDLTSGGFTKMADRLERLDYLRRERNPDDRRTVYAVLTEAGGALARQACERHVLLLRRHLLDVLGGEGVRALAGQARRLRDHSRQALDGPPDQVRDSMH